MTPKTSIRSILALATLAATAFLSQAMHAQIAPHAARVNVPFAFNVGSQHFVPGVYTISFYDGDFLRVTDGKETSMAMIQSGSESADQGEGFLTFRKYGNRYFLAEYHPANCGILAAVPRSKTESSVARDYAFNQTANQGRVRLALLDNGNAVALVR